jgi:hypothetical protein
MEESKDNDDIYMSSSKGKGKSGAPSRDNKTTATLKDKTAAASKNDDDII